MNAGFPEMKETGEASYQPAATLIQWQRRSSCQVMSHVARLRMMGSLGLHYGG